MKIILLFLTLVAFWFMSTVIFYDVPMLPWSVMKKCLWLSVTTTVLFILHKEWDKL